MRGVIAVLTAAFAFGGAFHAAALGAPALPPALVTAVLTDQNVRACARDQSKTPSAYAAGAFTLSRVTLRTGDRMSVLVASDGCLCRNSVCRVMIYERRADLYRRVLDDWSLPERVEAGRNGIVRLSAHESVASYYLSWYAWDGSRYVLDPYRSEDYDIAVQIRRPARTRVRFARGAGSATLNGSVARNLAMHYVVSARAGQTLTLQMLDHTGATPMLSLARGGHELAPGVTSWSGRLPTTADYDVYVFGNDRSEETLARYRMRLTIR